MQSHKQKALTCKTLSILLSSCPFGCKSALLLSSSLHFPPILFAFDIGNLETQALFVGDDLVTPVLDSSLVRNRDQVTIKHLLLPRVSAQHLRLELSCVLASTEVQQKVHPLSRLHNRSLLIIIED